MTHNNANKNTNIPIISVLATGGTIAGKASVAGSLAECKSGVILAEGLLGALPELKDIAIIRCRQVANIGSEDMTPEVWLSLAHTLAEDAADEQVAGSVILHGTDTMEETSFFLDLLHCGGKPVVMTGAMRPADAPSADGPMNILNAVRIACCEDAAGLVAMNDRIHRAADVVKTDTMNLDAFSSRGGGEGRMVDGRPVFYRAAPEGGGRPMFDLSAMAELPRMEIVYGHAGQRREMADAALATGAWGIVHAGVGMGNVHKDVRPALAEAAAGGVVVVCSSRVTAGPSPLTESHRRDRFVAAGELNPQKSRVLLQLALTGTTDPGAIQKMFDRFQFSVSRR